MENQSLFDEACLNKKLKEGDEESMIYLFNSYYKALVLYAQNIIQDQDIAEETVQDIFAKLWINRKNIYIEFSIKAYLIKAVKNRCLDYLKHNKVKALYINKFYERMLQISNDEDDILITNELSEHISKLIDALPEQCREVFKLSRFENKKNREIAEILGISLKTVEAQITKALKKLRDQLREYL